MQRSTKLEAVNVVLSTIGEATTSTITGTVPFEVSIAEDILDEVIRETLQSSFNFNTETDITFALDVSNKIPIATNIIRVVLTDPNTDVTIRDGYLYNLKDGTSTWTGAVKGTKVYLLDFVDCPEALKRYATIRAARIMADRYVGSRDIRGFTERDELEAQAKLQDYEYGTDRMNMLTDNESVYRFIDRRAIPKRRGGLY